MPPGIPSEADARRTTPADLRLGPSSARCRGSVREFMVYFDVLLPAKFGPPIDIFGREKEVDVTAPEIPQRVQCWRAKHHSVLVLSLLQGEASVAEAARRHALTVVEMEHW